MYSVYFKANVEKLLFSWTTTLGRWSQPTPLTPAPTPVSSWQRRYVLNLDEKCKMFCYKFYWVAVRLILFFISLSVSWQLCWSISLPTTRSQTSFEGRRWRWWRRTWPSCWAAWLCPGWPAAWSTWSTHHLARGQRSCRFGCFLVDFELLSLVHQGDGDALLDKNGMPKNLVRWSERQWNPLELFWIIQPDNSLLALLSKAQHKLLVWKYIVTTQLVCRRFSKMLLLISEPKTSCSLSELLFKKFST